MGPRKALKFVPACSGHALGKLPVVGAVLTVCCGLCLLDFYATRHCMITNTSITVCFLSLPLIRMKNSTISQGCTPVPDICRPSPPVKSGCPALYSCQHRHSRNLRTSNPLFSIVPDSVFHIPAHPSLALRGQDQKECHCQSLLSNPFTASSDDGNRRREWDCL